MKREVKKAKAIVDAISRFAFLGAAHPSEHKEIRRDAELAAKALLELQGVASPAKTDVDDILAGQ